MFKNLNIKTEQFVSFIIVACLLATYFLFLAHPVNLVTADLGRHIKNGEHFIQSLDIIKSNFYSYTYPDFPTTNHHWLPGVVFYLLWSAWGIVGVQVFFIFVSLFTLLLFLFIARKYCSPAWLALFGILALPLLNERTEIRPEVFSYLFSAIFLYLLIKYRAGKLSFKKLLWLLPVQIFWVNSHIYFFLGFAILGTFLLESLIRNRLQKTTIDYLKILILLFLVSFLNPFGPEGVFAPFTIWGNYNYRLVENQSILFLENLFNRPNFSIFKVVFSAFVGFVLWAIFNFRKNVDVAALILATGFSVMAWLMLRNLALFGFFLIPLSAIFVSGSKILTGKVVNRFGAGAVLVFLMFVGSGELAKSYPYSTDHRLGEFPGNSAASDFFKAHSLEGPIFNNYDNGGYLIYHLYPEERVFVDNRPEAYPAEFFSEVYIPMQQNEGVWKQKLDEYKFNSIFFYWRDATPWAQDFLIARVQDPDWAVVFVDQLNIIMLRRNEQNQKTINQYEITNENLQVGENL